MEAIGKSFATLFIILGAIALGILGLPLFALGPFFAMSWAQEAIRDVWNDNYRRRRE